MAPHGMRHIVHLTVNKQIHFGRVAMALRMIGQDFLALAPTSGSRGGRIVSEPSPHSCTASLMYCTSLTCVSRCKSGVYQR